MSIVRGIAAIREATEPKQKTPYVSLKDGDVMTLRFLQEFDEGSPNYNPNYGLAIYAVEWRDPANFRKRILDTMDEEGKCWPREQRQAEVDAGVEWNKTDWKPRRSIYVNVLNVDTGEVMILNQGFGPKSVMNWLIEYAEETGTITDTKFKFKRKGKGQFDTEYSLTPIGTFDEPIGDVEVIDIEDVALNHVPYAEQEKFFRGEVVEETEDSDADDVWG